MKRLLWLLPGLLAGLILAAPWARAQPPFQYFRLLDGTHNQAARVNHTGQLSVDAAVTVDTISHITSVTHIAAARPLPVVQSPQQGAWPVTAHQGGVWNINHVSSVTHVAVAGGTLAVTQSGAWALNVQHISGAVHLAGSVVDNANTALRVTGVTVFTVMGAIDHLSSVSHVVLQGPSFGGRPQQEVRQGAPGSIAAWPVVAHALQSGAWTIQAAHQAGVWTIAHVSSVTHVGGTVSIVSRTGTYAGVNASNQLEVNCTGCSAASVVAVSHISAAVHIGGTIQGAQVHIQGLGTPGQSHGGVLSIQGIGGGNPLAVSQSGEWNVRHISSVTHVATGAAAPLHIVASTGSANMVCHTTVALHQTATAAVIGHSQAGQRLWICSVVLVASSAQNVSLIEADTTGNNACEGATTTRGVIGGRHASIALAANGGLSSVAAFPWISTSVAGAQLCLLKSLSTGSVSGVITYRASP